MSESHHHSCCGSKPKEPSGHGDSCHSAKGKADWMFIIGSSIVVFSYLIAISPLSSIHHYLESFSSAVFELMNTMWWGIVMGVVMVSVVGRIPREFVMSALGNKPGLNGIVRATMAGVLLDLCSHGILMVGMKLYERGANIGQIMAFLLASPWNSFSLTLILFALIGLKWTLVFIALSMLIAISVGLIFQALVKAEVLPDNPVNVDIPDDFNFWPQAKSGLAKVHYNTAFFKSMFLDGMHDSKVVIRWLFVGVILAALLRTFLSDAHFADWFGPTLLGLSLTLVAATVIEVCSEGSTPIAADMVTRAQAPGNGFAFLMTGVATDYTEVMVIKDTTKSWKLALFLPLVAVPQVMVVAWLINKFA